MEESQDVKEIKKTTVKRHVQFFLYVLITTILLLASALLYKNMQIKTRGSLQATQENSQQTQDVNQTGNTAPEQLPPAERYDGASNLPEVTNIDDISLSKEAGELLKKNSFVVVPSTGYEFFSHYESNRYSQFPNFVTTDAILHNYHIVFNFILKTLEQEQLYDTVKALNSEMLNKSIAQYNAAKGTDWESAAKRNVGFFAVGSKLMDNSVNVPVFVLDEVNQELEHISKHSGIANSPVMNIDTNYADTVNMQQGTLSIEASKEDYSQYIPRGHYDQNEKLQSYFKTMMWYGRLTFRLKNESETKSAILISLNLRDANSNQKWTKVFDTVNFFVGQTDDINYTQYSKLVSDVYGEGVNLAGLIANKSGFDTFMQNAAALAPPQINSIPIFDKSIQPDREKEIKGFRYMGQRFTIDAGIMQKLIVRDTAENSQGESRYLPKGLDVTAAMGSDEALNILKQLGDTDFKNYPENMQKLRDYISGLSQSTWTSNLYWNWMYTLNSLLNTAQSSAPEFMKSNAWLRKQLNTYLGSWTELKHDTILYTKQVYAELGGGPSEEKDDRGYVEPNVELYKRLSHLIKLTNTELSNKNMLSASSADILSKMDIMVTRLEEISTKELNGQALTEDDYAFIRDFGGNIEHFWYLANKQEIGDQNPISYLMDNPSSLVADVATDPNGQVLEEATGRVFIIYVIVPVEGKLRVASGSVFSYYEFPWPLNDRLTDSKWNKILESRTAPELPSWTKDFIGRSLY